MVPVLAPTSLTPPRLWLWSLDLATSELLLLSTRSTSSPHLGFTWGEG